MTSIFTGIYNNGDNDDRCLLTVYRQIKCILRTSTCNWIPVVFTRHSPQLGRFRTSSKESSGVNRGLPIALIADGMAWQFRVHVNVI